MCLVPKSHDISLASQCDSSCTFALCLEPLRAVVQVVSVVGSTANQQDDTHSQQVAAATLGAIVPAWLRSGKPTSDLVAAVLALLPSMLPHRRLPLLSALLAVVPQVSSLCHRPLCFHPCCHTRLRFSQLCHDSSVLFTASALLLSSVLTLSALRFQVCSSCV